MNPIHVEAAGRIRGQSSIVIGYFNQIFRSCPLTVEPRQQSDRACHVGYENSIFVRSGVEQLILLGFLGVRLLRILLVVLFLPRRFVVPESQKTVWLGPALRLIREFTFLIGIGLLRRLPFGLLQFLHEPIRFARTDDELAVSRLVGLDRLPAVKTRIGTSVYR